MIKTFNVDIPKKDLIKIYNKVKNFPWHEMPTDGGWEYGTNLNYMKEISSYWVKDFDWRMVLIFILFMKKEVAQILPLYF